MAQVFGASASETERILRSIFLLAADAWLTPEQAAAEADVTEQTIYNWLWRKQNPLPAQQQGRKWRIRRRDLQLYIAGNQTRGGDDLLRDLTTMPGLDDLLSTCLRVTLLAVEYQQVRERLVETSLRVTSVEWPEQVDVEAYELAVASEVQTRERLLKELGRVGPDVWAVLAEALRPVLAPAEE
jgi:excisionase family DNA binding protein